MTPFGTKVNAISFEHFGHSTIPFFSGYAQFLAAFRALNDGAVHGIPFVEFVYPFLGYLRSERGPNATKTFPHLSDFLHQSAPPPKRVRFQ